MNIGVIEGFFGPQWSDKSRKSYAEFLSKFEGDFYIYAPKQDPYLRKKWRETWHADYIAKLKELVDLFHSYGIKFGFGFSPFGLGPVLTEDDKKSLLQKLEIMDELKIDLLGLFFDDMPTTANLAQTQLKALEEIRKTFHKKIIFCPSYYTPDPILDKVFGQRPENYLTEIAQGTPLDVSLAWTGPKVISPVIDVDHLKEVTLLLKRKPFIWENLFANDGPRNCKFLKLKPFTGRTRESFAEVEAFGFNMMNQPELSKILYLSSQFVLKGEEAEAAFDRALSNLCSEPFKKFILANAEAFCLEGLDKIAGEVKDQFLKEVSAFSEPAAKEIGEWLLGNFNVGSECLTD